MEKRVLEHYLETGKPLAIPGLLVREEVGHGIDPVGVYSTWAEPSQGWVPSMKSLREEVIRLRALLDAGQVVQR